jgi:nucleotide-binding universal stress UspA family protein
MIVLMSDIARPFSSILVPYDGSEPSIAALQLALAALTPGARLTVLTVVDEAPVIAQSATTVMAYDPTPLFEALDAQATAVLADATERCKAAGVTPVTETVHDGPVPGILAAATKYGSDLIVMGTHARTGIARTFLGSTTEGVLRTSDVPVLTTRTSTPAEASPFARLLVAVDDSDASDAAVAVAARLSHALGARLIIAHAADTTRLYENAGNYGFNPLPLQEDIERESAAVVAHALEHASIPATTVDVALVEGHPAAAILDAASTRKATAIVMGSHGRRGIRRFVLGSVAECVVRESDLPVLVVRRP